MAKKERAISAQSLLLATLANDKLRKCPKTLTLRRSPSAPFAAQALIL
jgi:hypothetical protein